MRHFEAWFCGTGTVFFKSSGSRALRPTTRNEAIDATRPVFAYPKVAHYKGTGSTNDAANFVAANPTVTEPAVDWLGARYLVPSTQQLCTASGAVLNCKPAR